jgi:cytochrome c-type biogenesis protein CcmH/NrfG
MYLSPEQAMGEEVDARSDLFSLGALLYECIAGKPPFDGKSQIEICAKVIRDDPPPPSELNSAVSKELDGITLKALTKDPEKRYQSADEMIADLSAENIQSEMRGSGQTVTRLISRTRLSQPTGTLATLSDIFKRPRLSIGYVAAALIVVGILAFAVWRWTRPTLHQPTAEAQRLYDKAVEAMREGAFFRASKVLQQTVQEDGQFALAHARLAECWTELDSLDRAKDELIRAKDLVPDRSILPKIDGLRL